MPQPVSGVPQGLQPLDTRPGAAVESGNRAVAQPGSALEWGSSGRPFKSGRPDQLEREVIYLSLFFLPGIGPPVCCTDAVRVCTGRKLTGQATAVVVVAS